MGRQADDDSSVGRRPPEIHQLGLQSHAQVSDGQVDPCGGSESAHAPAEPKDFRLGLCRRAGVEAPSRWMIGAGHQPLARLRGCVCLAAVARPSAVPASPGRRGSASCLTDRCLTPGERVETSPTYPSLKLSTRLRCRGRSLPTAALGVTVGSPVRLPVGQPERPAAGRVPIGTAVRLEAAVVPGIESGVYIPGGPAGVPG